MNKKVRFDPMPDSVYEGYMKDHSFEYAEDRRIADHETLEVALKTVEKKIKQLLPEGKATPNHYFYCVTDCVSNERVGYVWLQMNLVDKIAWLYHIVVFEKYRHQGYGRAAMEQVKNRARELGARILWLNVMGHNTTAQKLYESSGLKTAAIHMNVLLSDEGRDETR